MPATTPVYSGLAPCKLGQDHVVAGAADAAQNAQNLHRHGLGLGAGEHGPGRGRHAALNSLRGKNPPVDGGGDAEAWAAAA